MATVEEYIYRLKEEIKDKEYAKAHEFSMRALAKEPANEELMAYRRYIETYKCNQPNQRTKYKDVSLIKNRLEVLVRAIESNRLMDKQKKRLVEFYVEKLKDETSWINVDSKKALLIIREKLLSGSEVWNTVASAIDEHIQRSIVKQEERKEQNTRCQEKMEEQERKEKQKMGLIWGGVILGAIAFIWLISWLS